jgi:hypothetical protein
MAVQSLKTAYSERLQKAPKVLSFLYYLIFHAYTHSSIDVFFAKLLLISLICTNGTIDCV